MTSQLQEAIKALSQVQGAKFVSLTYRAKGTKELARHNLLLGVNVQNTYKRDLALLKRKVSRLEGLEKIACQELIDSMKESLSRGIGNNSNYTGKDTYESILPGIKLHLGNGELHLTGFTRSKVILEQGEEKKPTKSAELTLAKNSLRKRLKMGKFRQFSLTEGNIQSIRLNGNTIEIE